MIIKFHKVKRKSKEVLLKIGKVRPQDMNEAAVGDSQEEE